MKKLVTLIVCLCSLSAFTQPYNWMRWDTFPGPNLPHSFNTNVFTVGPNAYMFDIAQWDTSWTKGVKYHPASKTWTQLPTHPAAHRSGVTAFHHNGYFYCGFGEDSLGNGYNDLYKMDTLTGIWQNAGIITDTTIVVGLSFQIGGKIYIGASSLGDLGTNSELSNTEMYIWEYNPANSSFNRRANYPKKSIHTYQFNTGNRFFMGGGATYGLSTFPSTYEYDWQNDAWIEKAPFPGFVAYSAPGNFTRGNYGYVYCGGGQDSTGFGVVKPHMLRYDMGNDQWAIVDTFPFAFDYPKFNFMIGDDVYFCALNIDNSVKDGYSYQFYKYTDDTLATSIPIAYAEKNGLLAYPNPATGGTPFTIILPFDNDDCSYILNDITGREYTFTIDGIDKQSVKIRPENTAKGIYILRVMKNDKVYPVKLFID